MMRPWTNAQMCNDIGTNQTLFDASLVPPEIKPETEAQASWATFSDDAPLAERFRHGGWRRYRQLVYDSLKRTRQTINRIVAFDSCGAFAFVYQAIDKPGLYRLGGSSCRDRFCLPCARDRSRCLATNVLNALDKQPARFVTLTLRQNAEPLAYNLNRLYDSFRKLRAIKFWKRAVKGGCAFLEIKWSETNRAWNVHLHCIVHGRYLEQRKLSAAWYRVTGDSFIVHVKFIDDHGHVGRYVTKYASKTFDTTFVNRIEQLDQVVTATKGRRLCLTFGTWRGIKLTESPNEHEWISLGSFHEVSMNARKGDEECIRAIRAVCGDDADAIIEAAETARPPPTRKPENGSQIVFAWRQLDPRF